MKETPEGIRDYFFLAGIYMQLGQLLAVLNPTPAAAGSNVAGAGADGGSADQTFAQLLGDAGAKNAASDQGKQGHNASVQGDGDAVASAASTALSAQELNAASASDAQDLAEKVTKPITPDEAGAMLAQLEAGGASGSFMEQLKSALMAIRDGNRHESIASLVQNLANAQQATAPAEVAVIIQQVLHALVPEKSETNGGAEQKTTVTDKRDDGLLNALAQSLQASFFRSVDDKSQPASTHTSKQERKAESRDMVEIIPLSAIVVTNVPSNTVPLQGATSAIEPDKISAIGGGSSIPSLALVSKPESALPAVNLPSATPASSADKNDVSDALNALKSTNDERLNAALDAASASVNTNHRAATAAVSPLGADAMGAASSRAASMLTAVTPASIPSNGVPAIKAAATSKAVVNPVAQQATSGVEKDAASVTNVAPLSDVMAASNAKEVVEKTVGEKPIEEKAPVSKADTAESPVVLNGAVPQVPSHVPAMAATSSKLAAYTPVPVTEQVHVAVSRAAKNGIQDVTIQLDPVDLGRVEVKMHTGADGQTQIAFMVDKPSTLDSLARSAHGLERSLQEAGVKTDAGNMQFNLRQQPQSADTNAGGNGNRQSFNQTVNEDAVASVGTTSTAAISAIATRNYTLNIRDGLDIRA